MYNYYLFAMFCDSSSLISPRFYQTGGSDPVVLAGSSSDSSRLTGAWYLPKNISVEKELDESLRWREPRAEAGSSSSLDGTVLRGPGYWSLSCMLSRKFLSAGSGQDVEIPVRFRGK